MSVFNPKSHWIKAGVLAILAAVGNLNASAGDEMRRSDDYRSVAPRRVPKPVNDRLTVAREEMERAEDNAGRSLLDRAKRSRYEDRYEDRDDRYYDDRAEAATYQGRDRDRYEDEAIEQARFLRKRKAIAAPAAADCDCGHEYVQTEGVQEEFAGGGIGCKSCKNKQKLNNWKNCNESCDDCEGKHKLGKIISVRKAKPDCDECTECGRAPKDKCGCKLFGGFGKKKCDTCGGDGICDKRCLDPGCNREPCPCPSQEVLSYYRCGYYGHFPTMWRSWPENWLQYRPAPSETMYDRFRKPKPGEGGNDPPRTRRPGDAQRDNLDSERTRSQDPSVRRPLDRDTDDVRDAEPPRPREKQPPKLLTPDQKGTSNGGTPRKTTMLRLPRNGGGEDESDMTNARPTTRRY